MVSLSNSGLCVFVGQDRVTDFPGFAGLFGDSEFFRCSRRISILHGAVYAVLENAVRPPQLLFHPVLGG